MKISLKDQVETLEETLRNHRGYVAFCKRYASEQDRPKEILEDTERRLPYMEACLTTMQWLLRNEDKIKNALQK
jgi:hypothetical protein